MLLEWHHSFLAAHDAQQSWSQSQRQSLHRFLCTEQMDAEGLGRKLLLTSPSDPRQPLKSRLWVLWQHLTKMLSLQALSSSPHAGTTKRGHLGLGEAFGWPPAVCPPKRPRPFTHYRISWHVCTQRDRACIAKFINGRGTHTSLSFDTEVLRKYFSENCFVFLEGFCALLNERHKNLQLEFLVFAQAFIWDVYFNNAFGRRVEKMKERTVHVNFSFFK